MAPTPGIDRTVETLYRSISGPAGVPRDWEAMESVLLPGARLTRLTAAGDGRWEAETLSAAEYRATREPLFATRGFHEFETRREMDIRGPLANVYSWFTGRATPGGVDLLRGVNAIQLVLREGEWRVAAVSWYREFDALAEHGYGPMVVVNPDAPPAGPLDRFGGGPPTTSR